MDDDFSRVPFHLLKEQGPKLSFFFSWVFIFSQSDQQRDLQIYHGMKISPVLLAERKQNIQKSPKSDRFCSLYDSPQRFPAPFNVL